MIPKDDINRDVSALKFFYGWNVIGISGDQRNFILANHQDFVLVFHYACNNICVNLLFFASLVSVIDDNFKTLSLSR